MKKYLKRLVYSMLFFICFTGVSLGFLLFSNPGLDISRSIANAILMSDGITLSGNITGNINNLKLDKLTIKGDVTDIRIEGAQLKWSLLSFLLKGRLSVKSLIVENVNVHVNTHNIISTKPEIPFAMPFPLDAKNIDIHHVQYRMNDNDIITATNLKLKQLFLIGDTISFQQGNFNIKNGNITLLDGHIVLNQPFSTVFDLTVNLTKKNHTLNSPHTKIKGDFADVFYITSQGRLSTHNTAFPYKINSRFRYNTIKASLILPEWLTLESKFLFDEKIHWGLNLASDNKNLLADAKLDGIIENNNDHFAIKSTHCYANINNQAINCNFDIEKENAELKIKTIKINNLNNEDKLHLNLANQNNNISGQWRLNIADLSLYQKQLTGSIYSYGIFNTDSLEKISCQLLAENLIYHSLDLENLAFEIKAAQIKLQAKTPQFSGKLDSTLEQLSLKSAMLNITDLNLYLPMLKQRWKLEKPTLLSFNKNSIVLNQLCLNNQENALCFHGKITDLIPMQYKTSNINAEAKLSLNNLAWISDLFPNFPTTVNQGQINGAITIDQDLYSPNIHGDISLENGSVELLKFNSAINNISGNLNISSPLNATLDLAGKIDEQTLHIKGNSNYNHNMLSTKIFITGESLKLWNSREISLVISPKLTFNHQDNNNKLSGSIDINALTVNLDLLKSTSLQNTIQNDIVYVNKQDKSNTQKNIPFGVDIDINLGQYARLSGLGINTDIKGQLNISSEANQPMLGTGTIKATGGSFSAYGKVFHIDKSSKVFFNRTPIDNPLLDITANYAIPASVKLNQLHAPDEIIIKISGDAHNPKALLYSKPSLPQTNILSYILFGQSLADNNNVESSSALSQAAILLAINQGGIGIIDKLKKRFSLSEFSLGTLNNNSLNDEFEDTTTSNNNTAVFIGKWLTNRLYISYGVGIFTGEQQGIATYALTPQWKLKGNITSFDRGGDILYQTHSSE